MLSFPVVATLFAFTVITVVLGQPSTSCFFTRDNYGNPFKVCTPMYPKMRSSSQPAQPPVNCPPPPPVYLNKYYMPSVPYNVPPGCPTYGYPPSPPYSPGLNSQASYPQYGYPEQQPPYGQQAYNPPAYGQQAYNPPAYGHPPPTQYPQVTANHLPPPQPQQASPHIIKQKSSESFQRQILMDNAQYGEAQIRKSGESKSLSLSSQLSMLPTPDGINYARSSDNSHQPNVGPQVLQAPQPPQAPVLLSPVLQSPPANANDLLKTLKEKELEQKKCKEDLDELKTENKKLEDALQEAVVRLSGSKQGKRDIHDSSSSKVVHIGKPPEKLNSKEN